MAFMILHVKKGIQHTRNVTNTTARVSVAFRSLSSFLRCKLCLLFFLHAVAFRIICDFCRNLFPADAEIFVFSTNLTLFKFGGFSLWLHRPLVSSLLTELSFFVQLILFCKWFGEECFEECAQIVLAVKIVLAIALKLIVNLILPNKEKPFL